MSKEYSRAVALKDLLSEDEKKICRTLVGIAFCEPDWQWAQNTFLDFLESNKPDIRGVSATCLGHVARIHHQLDEDKVVPALKKYVNDSNVRGVILDALDDIDMFCTQIRNPSVFMS